MTIYVCPVCGRDMYGTLLKKCEWCGKELRVDEPLPGSEGKRK